MQPMQLPTQQVVQPVVQQFPTAPAMAVPQKPIDDGSVDMLVLIRKFLDAKKRDLTENTMRSYKSFCNGLQGRSVLNLSCRK